MINEIPLIQFGASISEKRITPGARAVSFTNDIPLGIEKQLKVLYVKILFEGRTRDEVETNISNFCSMAANEFKLGFKNKKTTFYCYPSNWEVEETGINEMMYIFSSIYCIEKSAEVVKEVNRVTSSTILVDGNMSTPATIEIVPIADIIDIQLEGLAYDPIVIKNLKANKTVIIDGELQKVTVDGVNKYGDTDMWEFPRLTPGANSIKVSRNNCNIKIKYKPRFI